ncbi:MAG: DnaJ C-terminal domain-containing protein [Bacteroidota bacterium]
MRTAISPRLATRRVLNDRSALIGVGTVLDPDGNAAGLVTYRHGPEPMPMAEISDHYKTLDVSETASAAEIKRAYRVLARAFHPDRNGGDAESLSRFRSIQEAYEVLSDQKARTAYDHLRHHAYALFNEAEALTRQDAYARFFGAKASQMSRDAEAEVRLSFEDALVGGKTDVKLPDGTAVTVPVPKGVRSGVKVRFKGRGIATEDGQGDLYVMFRVAPSARFRREGNDLHIVEPISVVDALLGTTRGITNAYGRNIKIQIPPGTQPGERLRLRGQGVQTASKKGDLYVEVQVNVPRSLTDEQRAELTECIHRIGLI